MWVTQESWKPLHLQIPLPLVLMVRRLSLGRWYSSEVLLPAPLRVCVRAWTRGSVQQHAAPALVSAVSERSAEDGAHSSSVMKSDESFHSVGDDERKRRRDEGRKDGHGQEGWRNLQRYTYLCLFNTVALKKLKEIWKKNKFNLNRKKQKTLKRVAHVK